MTTTNDTADREISATRLLDAPRELVFDCFTDPKHIVNWWGPNGFTNTIKSMDVRTGGEWVFTMHGPDGRDYANHIVYTEVTRPEVLAYKHVTSPPFDARITFADKGGKTEITMRLLFATAEVRNMTAEKFGAVEGLSQTLAKLGEYVVARADDTFQNSRTFDAPPDLIWAAWTEEKRLVDWFGPKGVPIIKAALDFRPGGSFHYCMRTPDGGDMWGLWRYLEIQSPAKIVLLSSFSDPDGNITRAPFSNSWPLETHSTTVFSSVGEKQTRVSLYWKPVNATADEIATFKEGFASMTGGWGGTFDLLAEYLANQQT